MRTIAERDALVRQWTPLVYWCCKRVMKLMKRGQTMRDMAQEGMVGLVVAAEKWDETRGVKFITYAATAITNRLRNYVYSDRLIALPSYMQYPNGRARRPPDHAAAAMRAMMPRKITCRLEGDLHVFDDDPSGRMECIELYAAIEGLPERERGIINQTLSGKTRKAIAADEGVSVSRIEQLSRRAVYHLRELMAKQSEFGNVQLGSKRKVQ